MAEYSTTKSLLTEQERKMIQEKAFSYALELMQNDSETSENESDSLETTE